MNANAEENRASRRVAMNDLDILDCCYNLAQSGFSRPSNQKIGSHGIFNPPLYNIGTVSSVQNTEVRSRLVCNTSKVLMYS